MESRASVNAGMLNGKRAGLLSSFLVQSPLTIAVAVQMILSQTSSMCRIALITLCHQEFGGPVSKYYAGLAASAPRVATVLLNGSETTAVDSHGGNHSACACLFMMH
jgi:hypothetical protein